MNDILTRVLELGGLGVFIWFLIRGLQQRISDLKSTVELRDDTLKAMETRVKESERMGELYRKLINELPQDLDKYKSTLRRLKDEVIIELEAANVRKDEKLAELTRSRLDEIAKQEKILDELPTLRKTLISTYDDLKSKLSVLDILQPGTPIGDFLKEAEVHLRERREDSERDERIRKGLLLEGRNVKTKQICGADG